MTDAADTEPRAHERPRLDGRKPVKDWTPEERALLRLVLRQRYGIDTPDPFRRPASQPRAQQSLRSRSGLDWFRVKRDGA